MAFMDRAQEVACLMMVGLGEEGLMAIWLVSLRICRIYFELSARSEKVEGWKY